MKEDSFKIGLQMQKIVLEKRCENSTSSKFDVSIK